MKGSGEKPESTIASTFAAAFCACALTMREELLLGLLTTALFSLYRRRNVRPIRALLAAIRALLAAIRLLNAFPDRSIRALLAAIRALLLLLLRRLLLRRLAVASSVSPSCEFCSRRACQGDPAAESTQAPNALDTNLTIGWP